MNITDIKAELAAQLNKPFPSLTMVRQHDEQGNKQEWLSHWDNAARVRVTMHEEIFNTIKANPATEGLALKREEVPATATRAAYVRYVVITPKNIEGTF